MNINLVPSSFGSRLLAVVLSVASVVGLLPATAAANSGTVVTRNTQETAWPSIVELSMTYGNVSSRCTGSIIDAHVVLTAAHCVDDWIDTDNDKVLENIELDSVTIQTSPVTQNIGNFGTPQPDGQVRSGRGVALHPTWRPTNPISQRGVDLAVVMLDRGVIAPADPLAERNPDVSDIVWIAGWGLENAEAPSDDQLRDGRMVRADSCPSSTSQTTQFCFDEWTAMACYGDSGGPVAWFDAEAGGYRLVGVMNSVTSCSVDDIDADNPRQLIAARVTGTNRQWIDAVVVEAHRTATAPQLPAGWFTLAPAGPSGGDPEFVRGEPVAMPDSGAIPPLVDDPHYDSEIQCILAGGANCDQYRGEQVIPAPTSPAGSGTPFVDVPADSYYSDAVAWMLESGITTGTSSTTYSPNNTVTRAQMAAFLWRAAGKPETGSATPFVDIPADSYYSDAVAWMLESGITTGTSSTTYSPNNTVTRAQMAAFQWRAAGAPATGSATPFVDIPADSYYSDAVAWMLESGITTGTSSTTYSPNNTVTRAQMAAFQWRAAGAPAS